MKTKNDDQSFEYDLVPYPSYPFPYTYPPHLRSIALLFGLSPPPLENARILELGASSGGNAMPFATHYPNSEVLAVDLSKVEIELGHKQLQDLDLKNLTLKVMDIMDFNASHGEFDYIICHGVFSWVPEVVRHKIFDIMKNNLKPNGIAYISYNVKPGWNMGNTIREMMKFHAGHFTTPTEQITQARAWLNFVRSTLKDSSSPYAAFLRQEAESLSKKDDSYLYGEYLVETNYQIYFEEFVKMAREKGLEYLSDTQVSTMNIHKLPAQATELLKDINDMVRREQYMDFMTDRRFRCTLLCHQGLPIKRQLNPRIMEKFYLSCHLVPEKPLCQINLQDNSEPLIFYYQGDKEQTIKTPSLIMNAILYTFAEHIGYPLHYDQLVTLAAQKLPEFSLKDVKKELANNILGLVFSGSVEFTASEPQHTYCIAEKPKTSNLVRMQLKHLTAGISWVTNFLNKPIKLNPIDTLILKYLDGHHTQTDIIKKLKQHIQKGDLMVHHTESEKLGTPILGKDLHTFIVSTLENSLNKYKKLSLLAY